MEANKAKYKLVKKLQKTHWSYSISTPKRLNVFVNFSDIYNFYTHNDDYLHNTMKRLYGLLTITQLEHRLRRKVPTQ